MPLKSAEKNFIGGGMISAARKVFDFNIELIKWIVDNLGPNQATLIKLRRPLTDCDFNSLVKVLTSPKLFSIFTPRGKTIRIKKCA
jgi:hypothetical protein